MSTTWKRMGGIEVFLHSFLTPALNGDVSTFNVRVIDLLIFLRLFNDCEVPD
jgi:hypothetical protein